MGLFPSPTGTAKPPAANPIVVGAMPSGGSPGQSTVVTPVASKPVSPNKSNVF